MTKCPEYDEISAELITSGGDNIIKYFISCVKIWNEKLWPEDMARSVFMPISKKGETLESCNNRTKALISHCSKILLKIIVGRMKKSSGNGDC